MGPWVMINESWYDCEFQIAPESPDRLAQLRLRPVEAPCRAAEVSLLGHGDKMAHVSMFRARAPVRPWYRIAANGSGSV